LEHQPYIRRVVNTLTATGMDHCKAVVSISFDDNQDHDDDDNES